MFLIQVYNLPGERLDSPNLDLAILMGILRDYKLESRAKDISLDAVYSILNKNRFQNEIKKAFEQNINLFKDPDIKVIYNSIDNILLNLNGTNDISLSEYKKNCIFFKKALLLISSPYKMKWTNKSINFDERIDNVEQLIECLRNNQYSLFDFIFKREARILADEKIRNIIIYVSQTSQLVFACRFARILKQVDKEMNIVLTGNCLNYVKSGILKLFSKVEYFDYVFWAHSELSIVNMFLAVQQGNSDAKDFDKIKNMVYKKEFILYETEMDDEISAYFLKSIPDFSDFNLNNYISKKRTLPILCGKGCYYDRCNFCSFSYSDGKYKTRSLTNLRKCLDEAVIKYKAQIIDFRDKCIPAKSLDLIADYILNNRYEIQWLVETRVEPAFESDLFVKKLSKAGCRLISFGIESACDSLLKKMNKGITIELVKRCLKELKMNGIMTAGTFVVGYFGEDYNSLLSTLNFILTESNLDFFGLHRYVVAKYSPIYYSLLNDQCELRKLNEKDLKSTYIINRNNLMTDKQIELAINKFYQSKKFQEQYDRMSTSLDRTYYLFYEY